MQSIERRLIVDSDVPFHIHLMQKLDEELAERTSANGASHPCIAETHNSIALIHHHMRHDSRKALRIHTKALSILGAAYINRMALKDDQDGTKEIAISFAVTLSDIGNVRWAIGDLEKAETAFNDAIHILNLFDVEDTHPRKYSIHNRLLTLHRNSCLVSTTANIARDTINGTPPPTSADSSCSSPANNPRDHHSDASSMISEESHTGISIQERSFEEILNFYQKDTEY